MKVIEKRLRSAVDELIESGADRDAVVTALNGISLELLTAILDERKAARKK